MCCSFGNALVKQYVDLNNSTWRLYQMFDTYMCTWCFVFCSRLSNIELWGFLCVIILVLEVFYTLMCLSGLPNLLFVCEGDWCCYVGYLLF